ncbi:hypothetical protein O4J56_12470 [Nocardiopsis sp. RSe5-2]|uniref:Guanylate cyclase domain-containing protein n=1 Tax=Nocardiopsis endophytica TaxID=3018445 RepID=A0ABT4U3B5_9ACTN|nr:hypothetical protein [Nocardiopsis endophytica]MDA2811449.1 hypothetical protein [Nocardiopsis endophytica]
MEPDIPGPRTTVPLPPYRAVLAVDMERFSRTAAVDQQLVGRLIPEVLELALTRSGLGEVWKDPGFSRHDGDGYALGTDPVHLPRLIDPFLDTLQEVLDGKRPWLAAVDRDLRMRMRVSLGVGPLPATGDGSGIDAMGDAMIDTHRLLDSDAVRRALAGSHPDTTLVAAIIGRRVYEDVVLGGFTGIDASRWAPVDAEVAGKGYRAEGYLYVPVPSTAGTASRWDGGAAEEAPDEEPSRAAPPAPPAGGTVVNNNAHGNSGGVYQMGDVHGGLHVQERP